MNREHAGPVVGVGGVVIRDGRALLIRRGAPPLEGHWSIPGGRLEWGETIEQAVVRELREETGLNVHVIELIEIVERLFDEPPSHDSSAVPQFHFVILDYFCEALAGQACAGGDALEVVWAAENELTRFQLTETAARVIRRAFALARGRSLQR